MKIKFSKTSWFEGQLIYTRTTATHRSIRIGPVVVKIYKGNK